MTADKGPYRTSQVTSEALTGMPKNAAHITAMRRHRAPPVYVDLSSWNLTYSGCVTACDGSAAPSRMITANAQHVGKKKPHSWSGDMT